MRLTTSVLTVVLVNLLTTFLTTTADRRQRQTDSNGIDITRWSHLTPTPPTPENVQCYVEVPRIERLGGRCQRMGRLHVCQSGSYVDPNSRVCRRRYRERRQRQRSNIRQ